MVGNVGGNIDKLANAIKASTQEINISISGDDVQKLMEGTVVKVQHGTGNLFG